MDTHGLVELRTLDPDIIIDLRYAGDQNFFRTRLYDSATAWLLAPTALKLTKAAAAVKEHGCRLVVLDAYRPLAVQQRMWTILPDPAFVAPVSRGSIHNRGAAIDVTLATLDGRPLPMPSDYDDFTERAAHGYTGAALPALRNRALLRTCMEAAGFKAYEAEWWHYSDPDMLLSPLLDIPLSALESSW
jgi:D-alanyl-D-alanine dipeptidase